MSEDVTARRARTLEALLSPVSVSGRPTMDLSEPADDAATDDAAAPEPDAAASERAESARPDAASAESDHTEISVVDDPREAMMVARIGALLGHPGTWQTPATPATLPEALLAEMRASVAAPEIAADVELRPEPAAASQPDATLPQAVPPVVVPPAVVPRRRRWPQLRWTPPRLALGIAGGLAALLLIVVMFGGDLLSGQTGGRQVAVIQLVGTNAAPQAHAELRATERDAGWRLVVDIDGLAPAPPDEYYQGWAVRDQEMVPLGTFHMHQQGEVELWSGVPLKKFSRIEVTAQRVGAGQAPGVLVMVGQM